MKLGYAQSFVSTQSSDQTNTHLQGVWLVLARAGWSVLVLFTLCVFIASLPASFAALRFPCTAAVCNEIVGQLTASDVQALQKLGQSLDTYAIYWITLNAVVGMVWCIMGCILAWRKSNDWLVLLVALMLISVGTGAITDNLLLGSSIWLIPENFLYLIKSLAVLFSLALFPNGRFVPRWTCWILLIYPAQMVFYLVFLHQLHVPGWSLNRNPLNAITWFGSEGVLVAAQIYRYFRVSNRVERQQTRWVAFSFLIILVADFGETATAHLFSIQQIGPLYVLILSIFTCMLLAFPFAVSIAILRYRLWDIDIIINRTLVYSALTASIIGIYVFVVGYLGALFRTGNNLLVSLLATGLVAVLFQPLREQLQRGVNRLFYGQRDEPYTVITELSQRLEATLTTDTILPIIVETVAQALKLPYAAILLKQDDEYAIAASYGDEKGEPFTTLHLVYQRETVGKLLLASRAQGEAFTPADLHLLNELTRQIGLAAHAVQLTADLQRSNEHLQATRARLVTTREEERRRLRRDLHDGLGPTLAALTLKIGAARKLLYRDPVHGESLLLELNSDIETTVGDIRRLVYNLRPPALDDLGLVGTIRERVAEYTISREADQPNSLHIEVDAPEKLPPLPAAVEVAAYRIAQEALTNVLRHAQAHTCLIRLSLDEMLTIDICDDGIGISAEQRKGVGIRSMHERAIELDGTCTIEPRVSGGTRVLARLPLVKE